MRFGQKISEKFKSETGLLVNKLNQMIKSQETLNSKMNDITDNQVEGEVYFKKILEKLENGTTKTED